MAALTAPVVGHTVLYGVSDNALTWWDNTSARHVGFRAQDSSEPFRAEIEQRQGAIDMSDPAASFQGGLLTSQGDARREHWRHFESRLALLRELGIPVLVVAGDESASGLLGHHHHDHDHDHDHQGERGGRSWG